MRGLNMLFFAAAVCLFVTVVLAEIEGGFRYPHSARDLRAYNALEGELVSSLYGIDEFPVVELSSLVEVGQERSSKATATLSLDGLAHLGPAINLDARSAQKGLYLTFNGEFSLVRRLHVDNRMATDSKLERFSYLEASALPSTSRLEVRHTNGTFGRLVVSSLEETAIESNRATHVSFSTTEGSTVYSSGEASEVLFDFSDHFSITEAVILDTAVSRQSGDEVLVVYSEGDDFATTELFLPSMESLSIVLGPHDDFLLVRHLPSWFRASLSLDGAGGVDELIFEEDLEENVNGISVDADKLTIRGALSGPCPVNIIVPSTQVISSSCVCFGPDPISIEAASIVFTSGGFIQTDDGDVTLVATTGGIDGSSFGSITTTTGDVSITSTGDAFIPQLAFGGNLFVVSTSTLTPITFKRINAAHSSASGIISVQAFFTGPSAVRTGIVFTDHVTLVDYDATFHTELDNLLGTGFVGIDLQAINWIHSTTGGINSLTFSSDLSGTSTASCVGINVAGTGFDLTDINMRLDSILAASSVTIVAVNLDTAIIAGTRSSLDIMGAVDGDSWTGVIISRGSIDLLGSGDINVQVDLLASGCLLGGCNMILVDNLVWNIVGDTSFNATNRAFAAGSFDGLNIKFASLSGSTLNIAAHGGADSSSGGVAVHITGGSILTYTGAGNILADSSDAIDTTARAFVLADSSLTIDNLDLLGTLGTTVIPSSNSVGITFAGATLTATGTTASRLDGLGLGATAFNGDQNHGVLFTGNNLITTNGANVEINGRGGMFSQQSHGVFMMSGSVNMISTGSGVITISGTAGGPIGGSQVTTCEGFALSSAVRCSQGTCELSGVCGTSSSFCRGFVALSGSMTVAPSATLRIDGDGQFASNAPGVDIIGPTTITLDSSSTLLIVGHGATGSGLGVSVDGTFTSIGSGTKTLIIDGTGGGSSAATASNHGVIFPFTVSLPSDWNVSISGQGGGGFGDDNVGVVVNDDLVGASIVSIVAVGGAGSGSFNHGMHLVSDLSALNVMDVTASVAGTGPNAFGFTMESLSSVTSLGTVQVIASASTGSKNIGCNILGDMSAPGSLTLNCSSSGSGFESHGIYFDNNPSSITLQGSPLVLRGSASLTSQSFGIYFLNPNGVIPSDSGGNGITIEGAGYIGVAIVSDLVFGTVSDVVLTGTASPSSQAGSVGVDIEAIVSGANNMDITGSGGSDGCTSGCFGILQLQPVECTGFLDLTGRSGGGAVSVGVRIGAQLKSGSTITVSGIGTDTSDTGISQNYGVDFINSLTFEQPMVVTGSHLATASGTSCHGIVFSSDIFLTSGGSLTASGTALANGSTNIGVFFLNGAFLMTSSSNTVSIMGTSNCPGNVCNGIRMPASFGGVSCNDVANPCTFLMSGDSTSLSTASGAGLAILPGSHFFFQTNILLSGTSISSFGVVVIGPITTNQQGSIVIDGTTTAADTPGVRIGSTVGVIPLNSGSLDISATAPLSSSMLPIEYPAGMVITTKTAGAVIFRSPVLITGGGTVSGPIDVTIDDGMTVQGAPFDITSSNSLTWNGASNILSDTSIDGGGFVSLGTPTIDLNGGTLAFLRDVLLTSDVSISSVADMCTFFGTINGPLKLIFGGAGPYVVANDVGDVSPLNTISLTDSFGFLRFDPGFTFASASDMVFNGDVQVNFGMVIGLQFKASNFRSLSSFVDPILSIGTVQVSSNIVEMTGVTSVNTLEIRSNPPVLMPTTVLDGDFSLTSLVTVRDDHMALLRGSFSTITARDTAVLSGGATGLTTACFTADALNFFDSSALQIDIEGADGSPCSLYDQVSVNGPVATSSTMLNVVTNGTVIRGDTYFVLKDYSALNAQFTNAPEGAALTVGPVVMFVTYLLDDMAVPGNDVALTANRLPNVMNDTYSLLGGLPVLNVPPRGVLLNDDDPEGATLVSSLVSAMSPSEGTVVLQSDGSFVYTSGGFFGVTSFTYAAFDGFESARGTVTINVLLPSSTSTPTPSATATGTGSSSPTPSLTSSATSTPTPSQSASSTRSSTPTGTSSMTASSTGTSTPTLTSSPSETPSATSSVTASNSPTNSPSMTTSGTPSSTVSESPTQTGTSTASSTVSGTPTASQTASPTTTSSSSATPSSTTSSSATPTGTISSGATPSETSAPSKSATRTFSPSKSPSRTTSRTPSKTASPSRSQSPSRSSSKTLSTATSLSASQSLSSSRSDSSSQSVVPSTSSTRSAPLTPTPSNTSQPTPTSTPSVTGTSTSTQSFSPTATSSKSASLSPTATQSGSKSASGTPTATVTPSSSRTASASPTSSNSGTSTATDTASSTSSSTSTSSASESPSSTRSSSASPTPLADLPSNSRTHTPTPSKLKTEIIAAPNPAPSNSPSRTVSASTSRSATQTRLPGTSASATPSALANAGQGRGGVLVPTEVTMFDGSEVDRFVPVRDTDGGQVGSVLLPQDTVGALVISSDTDAVPISAVVSIIVDVTVIGANGELITEFDDPIEICFETDEDEGDVCLGFYNEEGNWECEDFCLEATNDGVCGETDHLTSFALLLDSSAGSGDKCGSESTNYVIAYLSIAFISAAIVAVIVLAVLVEIRLRVKAYMLENEFRTMERGATSGLASD